MERSRRVLKRAAGDGRARRSPGPERLGPPRWAIGAVLVLLATVTQPVLARAQAEAATPHEIVWAHASPAAVARFVLFVSAVKGDRSGARQVDVGKPSGEATGAVSVFSAIVPIRASEFVALAAVGWDGRMSALSSWSAVPPTRPGQPIVIEP